MSQIKDSDIEMTNGTFIMNLRTQQFLDNLTNLSLDSVIKPDVAYGNKVLQHYGFEKSLESIPELDETGDNFDEWLEAIESLKTENGLLNCVLIPGACDEKDVELAGIKVAVEKAFMKRLHQTIKDEDLLETVKTLTYAEKVERISNTYKETEPQRMTKYVKKAYESNLIPDDINMMKEIFQDRIKAMMKTKSKYANVLLTTYFLVRHFTIRMIKENYHIQQKILKQ